MNNTCPKCGSKIKPTYLKPNCPKCNVNMLYYKLDEQLDADAKKASDEVEAVNRFVNIIKNSTIKTPWHIVRFILFFAPLASMCLPMYWAGHKNVSLITFIMSIINHGFDLGAIASDKSYLFAVLSMALVIVLSIVEIITSLFSSTKTGEKVFIVAKVINDLGLLTSAILCIWFDGVAMAGYFVTFAIFGLREIIAFIINKRRAIEIIACILAVAIILIPCMFHSTIPGSTICPAIEESEISVVSFNVASAFGTSLEDTDSMERCDRFAEYMNAYSPDFIGTQEMNSYWLERLDETLDGYTSYGVKRGGDSEEKNSEMNAIFFKDKFVVYEQNTIWLSETPNVESKYTYVDADGNDAEAGCNRICTYAVLGNSNTYSTYIFLNTHLDNSSEEARIFGANVILNKIDELQKTYAGSKVVLTGDFNETSDNDACRLIASKLNDTTDLNKEQATYQEWGYRQTGDKPIDFIYTTGSAQNYWVLNNIDSGYVSDHYGVYSEIKF